MKETLLYPEWSVLGVWTHLEAVLARHSGQCRLLEQQKETSFTMYNAIHVYTLYMNNTYGVVLLCALCHVMCKLPYTLC